MSDSSAGIVGAVAVSMPGIERRALVTTGEIPIYNRLPGPHIMIVRVRNRQNRVTYNALITKHKNRDVSFRGSFPPPSSLRDKVSLAA